MSVRNSFLPAAIMSVLFASAATAADIPSLGLPAAPAPALLGSIPAFSWSGFYGGLHAGYGQTHDDKVGIHHLGAGGRNIRSVGGNLKPGGPLGGFQFGHNWQVGSVVFGFEADATLLSGKSSFTGAYGAPINTTITSAVSKFGTASFRTRSGYAWGATLFYGTGGISVTEVTYKLSPVGGTPMKSSTARIATVLGIGVEHAFGNNWSARIEALGTPIGVRRVPNTPAPGGQITSLESQSHWQVRAGLNYLFGGPAAGPIIAKY